MSKEKQCECCHEWWYGSDVKEDLCPNCYDYFKQLKKQLKEYKNKENTSAVNSWDEMLKNCENCGLNECIGCEYTQTCVQNIKQQLAEKQKTIDEINKEFVQAVHDWKTLCAEKDKEIEEKMMSFEKRCQEYYKSDEFKRDFAIQELEKVKVNLKDRITMMSNEEHSYLQKVVIWYDICNQVNKQIRELKGE